MIDTSVIIAGMLLVFTPCPRNHTPFFSTALWRIHEEPVTF